VGNAREYPAVPDATTRITAPVTKYYYANGQRVAMRQGDVVYYIHTDHPSFHSGQALGSVSVLSDGSGHEVPGSAVRYLPYGGLRLGQASTLPTDYTFTGQRLDAGTGLYLMGARWYDPRIGRWISADTVVPEPGNPQALNHYAYVYNNPLRYTDPSGHFPWLLIPVLAAIPIIIASSSAYPPSPIYTIAANAPTDADALIEWFRTDQLSGDTVQQRLETILHETRKIPGLYTAGGFGETGLQEQFQDGYLYEQYWGGETHQIGHFLTAAAFGYRASQFSDPNKFLIRLAVGHEIVGDQGAPLSWVNQLRAATPEALSLFQQAIEADIAGDYGLRDEYLTQILTLNSESLENRVGNSLEDLRLTVRGWRFGQMIANGLLTSREEAAQWLNENIR